MPRFGSHRVLAPNVFMEVEGIDFEVFETGQVFEHRPGRTFTALENMLHALCSLDRVVDRHYAERIHGVGGAALAPPDV